MRGVNKRVIEIVEPENEFIERVVVFMKPGKGDVRLSRLRSEAESFAGGLVCTKRPRRVPFVLVALLVVAAIALAVFLL